MYDNLLWVDNFRNCLQIHIKGRNGKVESFYMHVKQHLFLYTPLSVYTAVRNHREEKDCKYLMSINAFVDVKEETFFFSYSLLLSFR